MSNAAKTGDVLLSSQARNGENSPADRTLAATQRKVIGAFAFALACLGAIGLASYVSISRLSDNAAWVEHTHEVLNSLDLLIAAVTDCETAERGYVLTGDNSYLEPYRQSVATIDPRIRQLRQLMADNAGQLQRLDAAVMVVTHRLAELDAVIQMRNQQGFTAAQKEILTGKGKQFHDQIRALVAQMNGVEQSLLTERAAAAQRSVPIARAIIVGGGILACCIVAFALLAIGRDFSGRRRAEQALRDANDQLETRVAQRTAQLEIAGETNARFASKNESSHDAIASKTQQGNNTSWNAGAERLFGYAAHEAVGQPMEMLIPAERAAEEPMILGRIMQGETTDHFETVRVRKDGQTVNVSVTISPLRDQQGRVIGASKIARDITERKRADAKVQAQLARLNLLQQITRAIGERQDIRSIYQVVIRTLEEHLPLDFCCICLYEAAATSLVVTSIGSHSMALAMDLTMTELARIEIDQNGLSRCVQGELVYEPDTSQVQFPFPQRLASGGLNALVASPMLVESKVFGVLIAARRKARSFSSGECEFLRQASEHVALAAHQTELYGALERAYQDLRQTQKAMLQQERLLALGQMASGIAHDINNAISPVALYTESLLDKEPDLSPRVRGQLETIQRAIDDVARTVARMREFYRVREPQLTLQPVNMNVLVRQVIDLTRARWSDMAQQRGIAIEIRTELDPVLPVIMGADNEIREALINLIFNAVDAMPNGGPLLVRTRVAQVDAKDAAGRKFVQVEVIDSGIGMDEDTRRRCLEPFFSTKGERGTGLGLAMVYGTMQRHSADIEIDSAVGQGTTIRLSFAVSAAPTVATAVAPAAIVVPPQRILLIDDDPLVLKSLGETLEWEGHSVTTADGGQAGIAAFLAAQAQGNAFPIVITDLGMPYVDGRKVAGAIKAAAPKTIVLMLTGWGQRLIAEGDIPPHVDRVLSKPPKLREVRDALALSLAAREA